jgi:hypothetical protein
MLKRNMLDSATKLRKIEEDDAALRNQKLRYTAVCGPG